jgi:alcohol dehydrogenase
MKAVVVPSAGAKWEVKEVPTPEPSANQVLIKIHASGVCHTYAFTTEGKHPAATTFPRLSTLTEASRYYRGAKNKE